VIPADFHPQRLFW